MPGVTSRPLTVLSVAFPLAPAGPDAVGGSEQVLTALDQALVVAGHRSIVIACKGSTAAGELVTFPAPPTDRPIEMPETRAGQRWVRRRMAEVLAREAVDVVHLHGLDFHAYLPAPGVPVLATVHLPAEWYPAGALTPSRPDTWLNGVSTSQAASLPQSRALLPPIPNGVAVEKLGKLRPRKCGYSLMLARVCPEKGVHSALEAAHLAEVTCLIGGEVFPYKAHVEYFEGKVRPLLDRRRRYLGPVGFSQKRRLLAAARCLLVPSQCAETSSLVAMEAASCGTPVIAFRSGALPEMIEDGRTGFLVDNVAEMAAAIGRAHEIDAEACRVAARRRFSLDQMAAAYIRRYQTLVRVASRVAA